VDAQVTVVDAALKGYLKWLADEDEDMQQFVSMFNAALTMSNNQPLQERNRNMMENSFEQWCREVLQMRFEVSDMTMYKDSF
jgi:exportin-5